MEGLRYPFVPTTEHDNQLPYCSCPVSVSGPRYHPGNGVDFSPLRLFGARTHFPRRKPEFGAVALSKAWAWRS